MSPHLANVKKKSLLIFFLCGSLTLQMSKFGTQSIRKAGLFTQPDKIYMVLNCKPISGLKILAPLLYVRGTEFFAKMELLSISSWLSYLRLATSLRHSWGRAQVSISSYSLTFPQNR